MNETDATKIIFTLKAAYPSAYVKYSKQDFDLLIKVWTRVLKDYSYKETSAGLDAFLASDSKGFPPAPGQVIDCIVKLRQPQETDTEYLAMIRKAVCNSNYHAQEEFDKLPEICQRAVGSPENLKAWAQLPTDKYETVISSNVTRALETLKVRQMEDAKIPLAAKEAIGIAERQPMQIEEAKANPLLEEQRTLTDEQKDLSRYYKEQLGGET